jgi:putative nucleotidyltransferase with HDIG domain
VSAPTGRLAELAGEPIWLVGGAVRDRLLGRESTDYDVVLRGDPKPLARAFARAARAHPFALSEAFGAWRVVARDHSWQVDLMPLAGETIEEDLGQRDLTVNAIAQVLADGAYVDPLGGIVDLRERRLRMVSPEAFQRDPLRAMRVARIACELDFTVEDATARAAALSASAVARIAAERVFAELKLILASDRALDGLRLLDELGVTEAVLPELARLHGIEQSRYHHLDVHEHTRAVLGELIKLEADPEPVFGEHAPQLRAALAQPLANELSRAEALRFGALFHDIAKPGTREVTGEGRVTFFGHDAAGAEIAVAVLQRLRASERLCEYVAALTRHHLRLGFLVHETPLTRRAVYRYLKACSPVALDVTVLSVADRLATRGSGSSEAIEKHLRLARQLLGEALAWQADPPRPPVRGDELARAAGIKPGPEIGRVLAELEEASFAGEINGREDALERGRELLAGRATR